MRIFDGSISETQVANVLFAFSFLLLSNSTFRTDLSSFIVEGTYIPLIFCIVGYGSSVKAILNPGRNSLQTARNTWGFWAFLQIFTLIYGTWPNSSGVTGDQSLLHLLSLLNTSYCCIQFLAVILRSSRNSEAYLKGSIKLKTTAILLASNALLLIALELWTSFSWAELFTLLYTYSFIATSIFEQRVLSAQKSG